MTTPTTPDEPERSGAYPPAPPPPTGGYPPPGPDPAGSYGQPGTYGAHPPAAPPPPPGSYGTSTGPTAGEAVGWGFRQFGRNLVPMGVLALVVLVVQGVTSYIGNQIDDPWPRLLWNLVAYVIGAVLAVGIIRAALAVADGRRPEVGMLARTEGVLSYIIASIIVGVLFVVGLIALILPGLVVLFLFQFYGFAVVDHPDAGPIEALKRSFQVTTRNVGQVMLFDVIAIGLFIVGTLLLIVGLLVAYPVVVLGAAYMWRRLSGGHVATLA